MKNVKRAAEKSFPRTPAELRALVDAVRRGNIQLTLEGHAEALAKMKHFGMIKDDKPTMPSEHKWPDMT